jgi:hypothetical protein
MIEVSDATTIGPNPDRGSGLPSANVVLIGECRVKLTNLIEAMEHVRATPETEAQLFAARDLAKSTLRRLNSVEPRSPHA